MSITTRGWGANSGIVTTHGFGSFGVLAPVFKKDIGFSPDYVHLLIDLRMKQRCKMTKTGMTLRVSAAGIDLDARDSGVTKLEVLLRGLEREMRTLQRQRRISP